LKLEKGWASIRGGVSINEPDSCARIDYSAITSMGRGFDVEEEVGGEIPGFFQLCFVPNGRGNISLDN